MKFSIELAYEIYDTSADFIFNIEAAQTPHQTIVSEKLQISQPVQSDSYIDRRLAARFLRLQAAAGPLTVRYEATVDINHHAASPADLQEMPISTLSVRCQHLIKTWLGTYIYKRAYSLMIILQPNKVLVFK